MPFQGRLGALAERNFRLVFSSTTISAVGDGVTTIALAFAVLEITSSASALGIVLAARQASAAAITVAAGVWADRLPRHLVLVAAALVQGSVQAVAGGLIITGHATVWALALLALVYGLADGFVIPTSQGTRSGASAPHSKSRPRAWRSPPRYSSGSHSHAARRRSSASRFWPSSWPAQSRRRSESPRR